MFDVGPFEVGAVIHGHAGGGRYGLRLVFGEEGQHRCTFDFAIYQ